MANARNAQPGEVVYRTFQRVAAVGSNFTPERSEHLETGVREAHIHAPPGWSFRVLRPLSSDTPSQSTFQPVYASGQPVLLDDGEMIELQNTSGAADDVFHLLFRRV